MNNYRVFYEWTGPSDSHPLSSKMPDEEVAATFIHLESEVAHQLRDETAVIRFSPVSSITGTLSVSSSHSCERVDDAVATALKALRLRGQRQT